MKILYVIGYLSYPLRIGPQLHMEELLAHMSDLHDCYAVGFSLEDSQNICETKGIIESNLPNVRILDLRRRSCGKLLLLKRLKSMLLGRPPAYARCDNPAFGQKLQRLISEEQFDLVHFFGFSAVGHYIKYCAKVPSVITLPDAQSLVYINSYPEQTSLKRRILCQLNRVTNLWLEDRVLPKFTCILTVSPEDAAYLHSRGFRQTTFVPIHIPRAVTRGFLRTVDSSRCRVIIPRPYGDGLEWVVTKVIPELIRQMPDVEITILSSYIDDKIRTHLCGISNVVHLEWAKDFLTELGRNDVVIVPDMHGTGMSTRVLTAMSLGIPVVGTPVAFRGLQVQSGTDCFIEADASILAQKVEYLLRTPAILESMGIAAKRSVIELYSFEKVMQDTEVLYLDSIKAHANMVSSK